ncbi:MAG TPA: nitrate reductase molybdenum cofactor assembly chaperone [Jatrophihabitantaceae bacterium]|nr:nitrate reductase molybdenum cofactor assembly chaperone [Jatrophihabitantaceae bacterium]
MTAATSTFKLASVLLQYPTSAMFDGLAELDRFASTEAGPKSARESFGRFLGWLRVTPSGEVAEHYVRTFDLRRRCALYLTYYRYGDTRKRGMAMVVFKTAYRDAGFVPTDEELPDFLPMVLDFAALTERGQRLLHGHRADLELLRRALVKAESPYADVVSAVSSALPKLGKRELVQVRTAWESGPPREDVGLEPFAPPEYLQGYGAETGAAR